MIYTLNFEILTSISELLKENNLERTEAVRVEAMRVDSKNMTESFPAPWIISCRRNKA